MRSKHKTSSPISKKPQSQPRREKPKRLFKRSSTAEMRRCRTIFGDRGSGKSTTLIEMILEYAVNANNATVVICPEPTLPSSLVAHLSARGQESRIILDYADPSMADGKFLQWPLVRWSNHHDPLVRDSLNEMYLDNYVNLGFNTRGIKDGSQKPYTYKFAKLGGAVMQGLPGVPARAMKFLFRLSHPIGLWMLDHTTNQEAADEIRASMARAKGKPAQYDMEVGATERLYSFLDLVPLWTHDGHTFEWKSAISNKRIVILDLSGVSTAASRTLGMSAYTNVIHAIRELFGETGEAHDCLLAMDEIGAHDWITPFLITAIQEDRKRGFRGYFATQTIEDIQPIEIREQILALTDHYWHHMSAGIERAAKDVIAKIFDSHAVLDTRQRLIQDGVEEITYTTDSESVNETLLPGPGLKKNIGKSKATQKHITFRPKFRTEIDKTFKTPQVQQAEIEREIATLKVGQFYYVGFSGVSIQTTIPSEEPWPLGSEYLPSQGMTLYEAKLGQAIKRIRSSDLYQPPQVWEPPTNDEPLSPHPSKPAPIPSPRTPKARRGMRGS